MRYRTKLYAALLITTIMSTFLCLTISRFEVRKLLLNELHTSVNSIAASTAASIDPEVLKLVMANPDINSNSYRHLQLQLRKVRDVNRRKDLFVKYVYIIMPIQANRSNFSYLIDAEETDSKFFSLPGESANEATSAHLMAHSMQVYSPKGFIRDSWGEWMIGYAPVLDSNGKYLATVGVNIYASRVMIKLLRLFKSGLTSFGVTLLLALIGGWYLTRNQTKSLQDLHDGVAVIGAGDLRHEIKIDTHDEFAELGKDINQMALGLRERERLLMSFTRYVSQHIMDSILKSEGQIKLSGERRKVTVLFSDIRNFTTFSERHDPEQVVLLLNEYFSVMVEIIFRNQGILDKFLGDGLMVEYGVPLDDQFQELNAVKTALEMQLELERLCLKWESEGKPRIEIGIGIHTGLAVIGNIGSERRLEYTAIGDAVNVAARLEQLTKELKTPVLISETTVAAIKDSYLFKDLGLQLIRGRSEEIRVYTVDQSS